MPSRKRKNVTPAPFDIPEALLDELVERTDPASPAPDEEGATREITTTFHPADGSEPVVTTSVVSAGPDDDSEPHPATLEDLSRALIPLVDQLRATVADIALMPFASATPEQRTALVNLRQQLDRPRADLSTWVDAIDISIRQAAVDAQAKEFLLADGRVTIEPPRGEWVVTVPALQRELKELMAHGLISQADIDAIVTTEVTVKANNAVLNQLGKSRGKEVAEAIARSRTWKAGNPTSARLRFERES